MKPEVIIMLRSELRELLIQSRSLQSQSDIKDITYKCNLLEQVIFNFDSGGLNTISLNCIKYPLKPTKAARKLIEETPAKAWLASELSDCLIELKKRRMIKNSARDLTNAGHYILHRLGNIGYVKKIPGTKKFIRTTTQPQ